MKRSGFTLVELLAVIVILGIILAIAVPSITGLIESARKGAFEDSVKLIIKSIQTKQALDNAYNINNLSTSTMENDLGVNNDNYESISASFEGVSIFVDVIGKNKWTGLAASGTLANMTVGIAIPLTPAECFSFNNSTGTITDYDFENANCPSDINIPSTIDDVSVVALGDNSFEGLYNGSWHMLNSVIIPNSVHAIGVAAFRYNNMATVTIPNGVTTIGSQAFYGANLTSAIIQDSVTTIGNSAFADNQLTTIILSSDLTVIETGAFCNNQLATLNLPDGVTTIGDGAFRGNLLTTLTIPEGVTTIGNSAFENNALTSISLPSTLTSISSGLFYSNMLTEVVIPNTITEIGFLAFANNRIESLTIPSSVTNFGFAAFNNNQLPDEQAYIYGRNPDGSSNSTLVSYGGTRRNNIVTPTGSNIIIGVMAFYLCDLTGDVTIGNGTISVLENAFLYDQLTNISLPDSLTFIGDSAFRNNQLTSLNIPSSVVDISGGAFNNNQLPDTQAFIYARNGDGSIDNTKLVSYGGAKLTGVVIPSTVESILSYAFFNSVITDITLPNGLISIDDWAFCSVPITSIVLPSTVTSIGWGAFMGAQLTSLVIPNSVTTIEYYAFNNNNFSSITIQGSNPQRFNADWATIGFPAELMQ